MITVLLAHDSNFVRAMTGLALRAEGYHVVEVVDGAAALAAIAAHRPAVVIANLVLPRLDGLALTRAVRADGWQTPVIITAIDLPDGVQAELESLGASFVEMDTFRPADVIARLRQVLPQGAPARSA